MTCKYFNRQHLIFFIQVYPLSFIPMRRNCRRPCMPFVFLKPFSLYCSIVAPAATRQQPLSFQIRFVYPYIYYSNKRTLSSMWLLWNRLDKNFQFTNIKTTCLDKLPLWCFSHLQFSSASGVEKFMKEGVKVFFSP